MAQSNFYMVLGINRDESPIGIRRAFRRLVKRYHPDLVGPKWRSHYQNIVEAYEVLSDPVKRGVYNRALDQSGASNDAKPVIITAGYGPEPEPMVPGPMSVMKDFQAAGGSFEALFERFIS